MMFAGDNAAPQREVYGHAHCLPTVNLVIQFRVGPTQAAWVPNHAQFPNRSFCRWPGVLFVLRRLPHQMPPLLIRADLPSGEDARWNAASIPAKSTGTTRGLPRIPHACLCHQGVEGAMPRFSSREESVIFYVSC